MRVHVHEQASRVSPMPSVPSSGATSAGYANGTLQARIMSEVAKRSSLDVGHRLQLQHQQYLDAVNRTRGIFRDTIIPAEYDPLQPHQ